jgi:hypothetical protein
MGLSGEKGQNLFESQFPSVKGEGWSNQGSHAVRPGITEFTVFALPVTLHPFNPIHPLLSLSND